MDYKYDIAIVRKNRVILQKFLDTLLLKQLNAVPKGFKNSIFWNIAHTVATQQILCYRLSGLPMLLPQDFIDRYKKGTKHEIDATQDEVDYVKSVLFSTLDKTESDYKAGNFTTFENYTVSTGSVLTNINDALAFNSFHEGIHLGYILALKKLI